MTLHLDGNCQLNDGIDRKRRIGQEPIKTTNPSCLTYTVQGSGGIMIWSIFCWHSGGALVFLEGEQTAMRYLYILGDQVHTAMFTLMVTDTS
ncbi:hypothetical protein TNCV_5058191 [Trichonephila clavipes]|nr:hypothetical protein TNCV_5058191 [Trichonephila clavipes]